MTTVASRLTALLKSSEHAVIGINAEGTITEWNKSAENLCGYTAQEACGNHITSLFPPKRREEWTRLATSLGHGETTKVNETLCRTKDGRDLAVSLTATPILEINNNIIGAWLTLWDMTESNRVREEYFFRSALLAAQQENCREGILVVDETGRMVSWNRRFVELWGLEPEVVASRSDQRALQSVLHKLIEPERFLTRVKHLYEHIEEQGLDELALTDGRVFERYTSPVFGDAAKYYGRVWYFRDVTALKRAEEQVRLKTEELQRSNQELELFSSIASHDLQAPLRKISAFGDLLKKKYAHVLDESGRNYLTKIHKASEGMHELIQALLEFAKAKSVPEMFQIVHLNAVMREVLVILELQLIQSAARVEVGPLPAVRGDPLQIRTLFQNLISNALKFKRPGTPPWISVRGEKAADKVVEITVEDNGIGIEREDLARLFQPFQRLNPDAYEGSGMGLAICHRIILRHGGKIDVDSTPGKGSIFRISLPAFKK